MSIAILEIDSIVTKVVLSGRIDLARAMAIDMPMSVVGGSRRAVVIDLSAVDFIASMGLRSVVMAAKAIQGKLGRVVLLAPQPAVEDVIRTAGIDELIPIFHDESAAVAAVRPS